MLNASQTGGPTMATSRPGLEAAYAELRRLGYDAAVFDFHFLTHEGQQVEAAPHRARVNITCTENNMHKVYDAVDGEWQTAFCADVQEGMFGPPPKGVPFNQEQAKQSAGNNRKAVAGSTPGRLWK
jgi:hypothetical protein